MTSSVPDTLFFADQIRDSVAWMPEEEMRHATVVLRKNIGDELHVTDGKGRICRVRIREILRKKMIAEVVETEEMAFDGPRVSVAVAPTKNFSRMEWCIEKLTEMGVDRIIPMLCVRSERVKWNMPRAMKVALSAMKQSKRAWLPEIVEPLRFDKVVEMTIPQTRYLCLLGAQSIAAARHYQRGSDVLMLIGPEGDFTEGEVNTAIGARFVPLSLGNTRLRTETAAIVAMATIKALNQS